MRKLSEGVQERLVDEKQSVTRSESYVGICSIFALTSVSVV